MFLYNETGVTTNGDKTDKKQKVNLSPSDLWTSSADSLLKRNYLLGTRALVKDTGNTGRYSPSSATVKLPTKTKSYFQS